MKHTTIKLTNAYPDEYTDQLVSRNIQPTNKDFDPNLLITDRSTVLKPDGDVLLKFLPSALPLRYVVPAWESFHDRLNPKKGSKRLAIANSANAGSEGVLGFMDGVYPFNYCRSTALTNSHLAGFQASLPMIRAAGDLFGLHMRERHAAQMAVCNATPKDYVIPSTPFTTVTINRDVTATYHRDTGDLKAGFGVIAATWAAKVNGSWKIAAENPAKGGYLVFPKFRVAVKIRTQDLLLCDVHECHGVTAITGIPDEWARLSFVFYCRERIASCGTPAQEILRTSIADTRNYLKPHEVTDESFDFHSDDVLDGPSATSF
jgi:hypothetical protein